MMEALEGIAENQERAIGEAITARSIAMMAWPMSARLHVSMFLTVILPNISSLSLRGLGDPFTSLKVKQQYQEHPGPS